MSKIFLHNLPGPLREALEEQIGASTSDAPDLVIGDEGLPGVPLLKIEKGVKHRLRDILKRASHMLLSPTLYAAPFRLGPWTFDAKTRCLSDDNTRVDLTDREADILVYLARWRNRAVMREELLREVWRYHEEADTRTLDTHVYRLRQKLGGDLLRTEEGGYSLHIPERGSVVGYVILTVFLAGLVVAAFVAGSQKHASSVKLDEMVTFLQSDIGLIQSAVDECAQNYTLGVDIDGNGVADAADNPNAPFPMYGTGADTLANLSSGGTGTLIENVRCPGASDGFRPIFSEAAKQAFKLLSDTSEYTTTYFTDATEGIYLRISRTDAEPLWTEALDRFNEKVSMCSAAVVTGAAPCGNGCLYYWIKRLPTSAAHGEPSCPGT